MATNSQSASDKRAALQQQIADLNAQIEALNAQAIQELRQKLSDARKVVTSLEEELADLTGKPAGAPKQRRERRPSITDDALKDQLIKVMASFGKEGMNAKQLAARLNQDPMRVRKFIADNQKVLKRTGKGPGTKFVLP